MHHKFVRALILSNVIPALPALLRDDRLVSFDVVSQTYN